MQFLAQVPFMPKDEQNLIPDTENYYSTPYTSSSIDAQMFFSTFNLTTIIDKNAFFK